MVSTPREYKELDKLWLRGNVALIELQLTKSSLILEGEGQKMDGMPTGWGYFIEAGDDVAQWVKAIPKNTAVRLEGLSLTPMIDISNTSVPKWVPNPDFPVFSFGDPSDPNFDSDYKNHPTILVRNPDFHIVAQARPTKK